MGKKGLLSLIRINAVTSDALDALVLNLGLDLNVDNFLGHDCVSDSLPLGLVNSDSSQGGSILIELGMNEILAANSFCARSM